MVIVYSLFIGFVGVGWRLTVFKELLAIQSQPYFSVRHHFLASSAHGEMLPEAYDDVPEGCNFRKYI